MTAAGERGGDRDSPVSRALLQRGLAVLGAASEGGTFLPALRSPADRREFFELLRSYAFRLFLRDILVLRDRFSPGRMGPFFTPESIEEMADAADRLGIIRRGPGGSARLLADNVVNFGDTFEWFVAELLRTRFSADALWGVTVPDLPCGGDFDVLGLVSGKLLYIETKTSPPKHIELAEISSFLKRVRSLSPDIAIMLVDTHLRMKDKLVPLLEEALRGEGAPEPEPVRVEKETFHWGGRIFLTKSRRDVESNLGLCLRSYFLDRFFG